MVDAMLVGFGDTACYPANNLRLVHRHPVFGRAEDPVFDRSAGDVFNHQIGVRCCRTIEVEVAYDVLAGLHFFLDREEHVALPLQPLRSVGLSEKLECPTIRVVRIRRHPDFTKRPHAQEPLQFPIVDLFAQSMFGLNILQ